MNFTINSTKRLIFGNHADMDGHPSLPSNENLNLQRIFYIPSSIRQRVKEAFATHNFGLLSCYGYVNKLCLVLLVNGALVDFTAGASELRKKIKPLLENTATRMLSERQTISALQKRFDLDQGGYLKKLLEGDLKRDPPTSYCYALAVRHSLKVTPEDDRQDILAALGEVYNMKTKKVRRDGQSAR
ncbi:uncharacterized protein LOC132198960 isoform X2 [Neocloeon triangulifer]|nr:uncharacterized protein LOC132198960 isoform X2 [Neocloeon triangulifer]